jgi:glycosyltransferase involved in cell wall biosynthesis
MYRGTVNIAQPTTSNLCGRWPRSIAKQRTAVPAERLSIVLPVYNGAPYIEQSIQSVLNQSYGDWALYVVDDASTDDSLTICEMFSDPRIKVLRNERNLGQAGNWNRSTQLAQGEYVKLLCADDALAPGSLASQVDALDQDESVALVTGKRRLILSNGLVVKRRYGLGSLRGRVNGKQAIRTCVRSGANLLGEPPAVMFRRSSLPPGDPWRPAAGFWLDFDLWARILQGGDLVAMDRVMADFRIHAKSDSATVFRDRQVDDTVSLFTRLAESEPLTGVSPDDVEVGVRAAIRYARHRRRFYKAIRLLGFG